MNDAPSVTGKLPGDAAFRRKTLKGSSIEATYAGALSFMRRKYTRDLKGVDVAVTGIPFDQSVSNRREPASAPRRCARPRRIMPGGRSGHGA